MRAIQQQMKPQKNATATASKSRVSPVPAVTISKVLGALSAGILLSASPSLADNSTQVQDAPRQPAQATAPSPPPAASTAMAISFTRVSPELSAKLKQRDEMAAWKCTGASMYDCDGERAEASEKFWNDVTSNFRPQK